jgi:hypothetical protein
VPRFALVGNNRILRYVGHVASDGRPRASYAGMSTAAPLPRAFDRRGAANIARTTGPLGAAQHHVARHDFRYSARMSADIFGTVIEGC